MAKNNKATTPQPLDQIIDLDSHEYWDVNDPSDQLFWEEFFKIEEALSLSDELDPPRFSVTVQNHDTGETKTFSNIHLQSVRKKIMC